MDRRAVAYLRLYPPDDPALRADYGAARRRATASAEAVAAGERLSR